MTRITGIQSGVEFSTESDVRPISKIVEGTRDASGRLSSGYRAGKRIGWGELYTGDMVAYQTIYSGADQKQLTIGRVLANERDRMHMNVQPYLARWSRTKVTYHPHSVPNSCRI